MSDPEQFKGFASPWTFGQKVVLLAWGASWKIFCSWTPKPFNGWRLIWLKIFGAKIHGTPFVHPRARIQIPWNLTMHHRSCLGDRANAYSLGLVQIGAFSCVAQEAYLCTGTHDFDSLEMPLITKPIIIGEWAFIGARAFIMPGIEVGSCAIVGAASVVTRNVLPNQIVGGNPAKVLKTRPGNPGKK
jgi:putative colanic acid biosynthesis acetyltransferase WcaF